MRKWLIGLGLVLAIVLVLSFLLFFDVYNQRDSIDYLVASSLLYTSCPITGVEFKNEGVFPTDLGSWKIGSGKNYFNIPAKTIVAPGDSIMVWGGVRGFGIGRINESSHDLYMGGRSENGWILGGLNVYSPKEADGKVKVSFSSIECVLKE